MGVVFLAHDLRLDRRVAIKLIQVGPRSADFRSRFITEARAMASVSHPNVVSVHAFGEHEGAPYLVMELVVGRTLESWLEEQGAEPNIDEALAILDQVCLGVSAIHATGTLHRDLKPGNILLDHGLRARVADFGLAIPFQGGRGNKEQVGTPGFVAPEIHFDVRTDGGATPRSDVYSLACVAFEMLVGKPPYEASDALTLALLHGTAAVPVPSELRKSLGTAFDRVFAQALAKDPHERTASVELLRRSLRAARTDSLEPSRILVAEDDPDFRELLQLRLQAAFPDAEVECVADGRRAVEAFDREVPSVVVLDLQLPTLDGMGVTALLRARPEAENVPIIVVSASGGPAEWQLLASLGADRFMVKPISLEDLVSVIHHARRERSDGTPARHLA